MAGNELHIVNQRSKVKKKYYFLLSEVSESGVFVDRTFFQIFDNIILVCFL